jgi:RNA polymerase sigma-70 factor (ECF subfamily)
MNMPPKKTKDPDNDIVKGLKKKNMDALMKLVDRYHEKVYSLSYSFTRNSEDAEEVVQDTFTTVWKKIGKFKHNSAFSSWLYRVTSNAALMKLRSRKKERYVLLEDTQKLKDDDFKPAVDIEDDAEQIEDQMLTKELKDEMLRALEQLSDIDKRVFKLRDVDGFGNADVSHMLDLTVSAVKARLHRARIAVKNHLRKYLKEASVRKKR